MLLKTEVTFFIKVFVENKKEYQSMHELDLDIDHYKGIHLVIHTSSSHSRMYCCGSYIDCSFKAKFGRIRNGDKIAIKVEWSHLFHKGENALATAKGCAYKQRMKDRIDQSVELIHNTKHSNPLALDVVKTAGNFHAMETTYKQAHQAMDMVVKKKWDDDATSYELVAGYLTKFHLLNEGSTTEFECNEQGHLSKLFVCPHFMNNTI